MLLCEWLLDAADDVKSELFIVVVVAVFAALSFNNSVAFVFEGKKKSCIWENSYTLTLTYTYIYFYLVAFVFL